MGSALSLSFLESLLLLETRHTLTITSWIIVISHSDSPDRWLRLLSLKAKAYHVDPPHFQLQSPSRTTLPKGQHSLCWDHTWSQKAMERRLLHLSARSHELLEAREGVSAYDTLSRHLFALHAYLIAGFGNIPAVSMLMHMKGHNGLCPC